MRTVTGVFSLRADAERAVSKLRAAGVSSDRVTFLLPDQVDKELKSVPVVAAEQPGMGKAIGALVGAAAGGSGSGFLLAALPGVGAVAALGVLGAAILTTAGGALIGAMAGRSIENSTTEGLPEDEIFVYEDALRKGRSVVVALAEGDTEAAAYRDLLKAEGAESIDDAREQWWIGLHSAEQEHYSKGNRNFKDDERFYRRGFEAALHARNRCKEFDQISAEFGVQLEELKRKYPEADVEEAFRRGFDRGREYYQHLCKDSKAA